MSRNWEQKDKKVNKRNNCRSWKVWIKRIKTKICSWLETNRSLGSYKQKQRIAHVTGRWPRHKWFEQWNWKREIKCFRFIK